ncbi:MAG: 50S ribosomal protein L2 [Candidatus Helarchaeota archaeon]|nr:50S ribosomal protein L2 [Candidatus Helarchaeota archaeon]
MGKRIRVQRRNSPTFKANTHKRKGKISHLSLSEQKITGIIIDLVHESGRGAPLALINFDNGKKGYMLIPEGVFIGQKIEIGEKVPIKEGNSCPLKNIPEGTPVFNIELKPGDGGKLVRAGGTYGTIISRSLTKAMIRLPSGKLKSFIPTCRATIGIVAGGGRPEKPIVKAGKKFHMTKAKRKKWPITRGVAMNTVDHPHGGGGHQHIGKKGSTVSRNAPPGRKVGLIAARRSGRKKK